MNINSGSSSTAFSISKEGDCHIDSQTVRELGQRERERETERERQTDRQTDRSVHRQYMVSGNLAQRGDVL